MSEEEVTRDIIVKRLRRIEGQIRGIQKMVAEGRECESVITQLVATRSAIDSVGALVLNNYMKLCFLDRSEKDPEVLNSLARSVAIWGRVHGGKNT